jgi:signal peptide peptidase SppA
MTLIDILTEPWAIVPSKLLELQAIYATHLRGEKIDLEAIEARLGRPLANDQKDYALQDGTGVAVLDISGVISPKANMFTRVSGGAAASMLQQQVQSMQADSKVRAVVLNIDSPGGNVLGIPALADAIRALAAVKPTVAVCTGMMASAGYWVGSAANAVYISGLTDYVGSIGVVATHTYDPRRADVQTTEITAGKFKRMATEREPLNPDGRAYLQAQVDEIYRVFVETVASARGVSAEDVVAHMGDGRTFIGQQAIDAGLVDGISSVDAMVEQLAAQPEAFATRRRAAIARKPAAPAAAPAPAHKPAKSPASAAPAAAAPPAAAASGATQPAAGVAAPAAVASPTAGPVLPATPPQPTGAPRTMSTPQEAAAAFAAENAEAAQHLRTEAAAAERARILAVRAQAMPGHEALIDKLAFDGTTTGPEAAVQVIAAEQAKRGATASARAADAPKPLANAAAQDDNVAAGAPAAPAAGSTHVTAGGLRVDSVAAKLDADAKAHMAANPGTTYLAAVKHLQAAARAAAH